MGERAIFCSCVCLPTSYPAQKLLWERLLIFSYLISVTRLGNLVHFWHLFKACAINFLPKLPTFLGNFFKGFKIFHFWATFIDIWRLFTGHTGSVSIFSSVCQVVRLFNFYLNVHSLNPNTETDNQCSMLLWNLIDCLVCLFTPKIILVFNWKVLISITAFL